MPEFLISRELLIFSAGLKQTHQVCGASLSPPSPSNLALLRVHLSDFVRLLSLMMPELSFQCSPQLQILPRFATHIRPAFTASSLVPTNLQHEAMSLLSELSELLLCKFLSASFLSCSSPHHALQCWAAHTPDTHLPPRSLVVPLSISF